MSKHESTLKRTSIDIDSRRQASIWNVRPNQQLLLKNTRARETSGRESERQKMARMYLTFVCISISVIFFFSWFHCLFLLISFENSICCFIIIIFLLNVVVFFRCCEYVAHFFSSGYMRRFFAPISVFSRLFLVCSIDSDVYVCISLVNVNFMLLFKLNILPYVCFPFYCHALSHLSLIETVMFTLYSTINGG